ncbi:MAG: autotransporter assembly complex protein TamA [Janthinobacterium lividum]
MLHDARRVSEAARALARVLAPRLILRWAFWLAWAWLMTLPGIARAEYKVTIDAPRPLRKILEQHLDLARFADRKDISDEQFDFLLTAVPREATDLVQTEGYFSPVITTDVTTRKAKKNVRVTVDPGPRTTISTVRLDFQGPMLSESPDREAAARAAWTLRPGEAFSQAAWDAAKNAALKSLQSERYLGAKIAASRARVDPRTRQASLYVAFESGPTFRMGQVTVAGLKRYPETIVEHVNPLYVGEPYSAARVQELQRQVQSTPYFASVAVDVGNDRSKANDTPVNVKVAEFPYQSVRSGIGYTTDTGGRVESSYSYNNVFGRAWVFSVQGRLEQDSQYGALTLSTPPDSKAYVNSATLSETHDGVQSTDIYSQRIGVTRTRSLQYYDYNYSLLYYRDRLTQNVGPESVARAIVPAWSWTRRNVDDPVFPRKGNLLGVEAGFSVKGIADASFARLFAHARQYIPIDKSDLLLLRAQLGGVFSPGSSSEIPASLLFRAGGAETVRGYSYESIGNSQAGSVLPTKYTVTAGAEYQHWFSHDWGAAVFYDAGTATDNWAERQFFSGTGVGARWRSPVGPINLDVAYGIQHRSIRPYLTLGIAF